MRRLASPAAVLLAAAGLACGRKPAPPASLQELELILASRNDNDPRLDRDFNALTDADKREFRQAYAALPRERRNERGTIVYLLGRNAAGSEDWAFLKEAAGEPACLSLSSCDTPARGAAQPGDAVTLAYPALVALKSAERALSSGAGGPEIRAVLDAGAASKAPAASSLARRLLLRFPHQR